MRRLASMLLRSSSSHSSSRQVSPCSSHTTSSRLQWLPRQQRALRGVSSHRTPAVAAASGSPAEGAATAPGTPHDVEWDAQWPDVEFWRRCLVVNVATHVELVRGVSFDGRQAAVALAQPGQGVIVAAEPSNPADPHAQAVYTAGMRQLGYMQAHVAKTFPVKVSFGHVVSGGRAEGSKFWGVKVAVHALHPLWLDWLPDSWQQQADLGQVLGAEAWAAVQEQVLRAYGRRCGISAMPEAQLAAPLRVVPQWGFDALQQRVYLTGLLPVSRPLLQLKQQLARSADALLASARVQEALQAAHAVEATLLAELQQDAGQAPTDGAFDASVGDDAVAEAQLQARVLRKELQVASGCEHDGAMVRLQQLLAWPRADCVLYVAHAAERQWALADAGWSLVPPTPQDVAAIIAAAAGSSSSS